jgi:hypothetical protein
MDAPVLSYENLKSESIRHGLMLNPEVHCEMSLVQAKALQSNWAKYGRYYLAHSKSPRAFWTAVLGLVWIFHRAVMGLRFPKLDCLITVYTQDGYMMGPVNFEKTSEESARLTFTRKIKSNEGIK